MILLECLPGNMPTPVQFTDYFLCASTSIGDFSRDEPLDNYAEAKLCMKEHTSYFLEASLRQRMTMKTVTIDLIQLRTTHNLGG